MTIVLRISDGFSAKLIFLIFVHTNSTYPIQGSLDNVPGIFYSTNIFG